MHNLNFSPRLIGQEPFSDYHLQPDLLDLILNVIHKRLRSLSLKSIITANAVDMVAITMMI